MERYLAIVTSGEVSNIVVVDPNDAATIAHFGGLLLPEGSPVGIGYTYDGTDFAPPSAPPPSTQQQRDAIQAQIDALERTQIMPRITRESLLILMVSTAASMSVTEPQLYAANVGYSRLKDFDSAIVALRSQMAAIP